MYALIDPRDNQVRYIGKSDNPYFRFKDHIVRSRKEDNYKSRWICVLISLNLLPILQIIKEVLDKNWQKEEQDLIQFYRYFCNLTNTTIGGDCGPVDYQTRKKISIAQTGRKHTKEHKEKMSNIMKGRKILWKDKISEGHKRFNKTEKGKKMLLNNLKKMHSTNTGSKHTDEHKKKISESHMGIKNYKAVAVAQIDIYTNKVIKIWDCQADVQREINIFQALISKCCSGQRKTTGGFKWKYVDDVKC